MNTFLHSVARHLLARQSSDLSRTIVVFPNKRASLFFNEYLVREVKRPLWAPAYLTINELFQGLSSLKIVDPIEAVCRLYRIYIRLTGSTDSLDFFYGWGEKVLHDFNDVDKNLVDAQKLFQNLSEIKNLEKGQFLTPEQEAALKTFFHDFSLKENSLIKQKFLDLWNQLLPLYESLNAELKAEGLAYEGALFRQVIQALREGGETDIPAGQTYAFVGFNRLTGVEEELFRLLQEKGQALFYWDYDDYYAGEATRHEAGTFIRRNLKLFPNELPDEEFRHFRAPKEIVFISSPTESAQAHAIGPWLQSHLTGDEKETAIVLCNEQLLQPVLYALPPNVKEVNITKGFPLSHTPVYTLVADNAPDDDVQEWLNGLAHKVQQLSQESDKALSDADRILFAEACFQTYTVINRFVRLVGSGLLAVSQTTLHRLLLQVLRQATIPFHGEPAAGVQIMGLLETRCLDFQRLLILSANEGQLPRRANGTESVIPYLLRKEFGLSTPSHDAAVFAYHFYRLLQRASHASLAYVSTTSGTSTGEMSRFMTQLLVESPQQIKHCTLATQGAPRRAMPPVVEKPENLHEILARISPSAINTYLRCPLQFYFQRVARLKEPPTPPDVIEPNTFGTLFHKAAELFYRDVLEQHGGLVTKHFLDLQLEAGKPLIMQYIGRAGREAEIQPNLLIEEVVARYLRQLLLRDREQAPFRILALEKPTQRPLRIPLGGGMADIELMGEVDRLDRLTVFGTEHTRIIDYKTGGQPERATSLEQLFTPGERHPHYLLQTCLYALTLSTDEEERPIVPALFYVHHAAQADYSPYLEIGGKTVGDFRELAQEFLERLTALLAEILDPDRPFAPTSSPRVCASCPFLTLCQH